MEPANPTSPPEQQPRFIPWEEQLQDHTRKLEEYLQNLLFRGCTLETTIRSSRAVLNHLFDRLQIQDPNHPRGIRQLLVWELLDPGLGSSRLGLLDFVAAPGRSGTRNQAEVYSRAAVILRLCPCQT